MKFIGLRLIQLMVRKCKKHVPAAIVSPDEMNDLLKTVLVAPITSRKKSFPTRISFDLNGTENYLALDQIRTVDKSCLQSKIGNLSGETAKIACDKLQEMFAY